MTDKMDHSGAVARVQKFLDVCGTPSAPIATAQSYDNDGRWIPKGSANLFAADVRALLEATRAADEMLGLHRQ